MNAMHMIGIYCIIGSGPTEPIAATGDEPHIGQHIIPLCAADFYAVRSFFSSSNSLLRDLTTIISNGQPVVTDATYRCSDVRQCPSDQGAFGIKPESVCP